MGVESASAPLPASQADKSVPTADKGPDWFDRAIKLLTLIVAMGALGVASYQLNVASTQLKKFNDNVDIAIRSFGVSLLANSSNYTLQMSKAFVDNPDMRPYFYEGKDIKETDPNYMKVKSFAYFLLDFFDATRPLALRAAELPDSTIELVSWDTYYVQTFQSSPLLCRLYLQSKDQYGGAIRQIAEPTCNQVLMLKKR